MNLKPLDLEGIAEWLEKQIEERGDFLIKREKINPNQPPLFKEIVFITRIRDILVDEIKQRIKQACDGFLDEIKQLEQEDGVICTDFDELQSIFKEWFAEVMEDD